MSIGFADTSSFIGSGIHLKWERRRSRHFSRGSQQIDVSVRQRRIRRSGSVLFLYRDVLHIEIGLIENVPRARMPVRVPVVLSRDEVARILKSH